MQRMISWFIAVLLFSLLPCNAGAEDKNFILDVLAPASQEVPFTVPPSGSIPVKIMYKSGTVPGGQVDLSLSEFIGPQGASANVKLSVDNLALSPATAHKGVSFTGTFLPIHLAVPPFPSAGTYSGTLALVVPGKGLGDLWRFKLTSSLETRPATLVLDQVTASLNAVKGSDKNPVICVHVRDKTGLWMLEGITARLDPGLIAPEQGFDFKRNMLVSFNGEPVENIGISPSNPGKRSIPPREQAAVQLQFKDLDVGTYTIPLRFSAANSGIDDQQRMTVTIQVRHWWPWAVITLLIAALFSFTGTQVVSTMRRRAAFVDRVCAMRPAWLAQEYAVLPVIWLKAKVRQIEDLSCRFWLTGQSEIDTRLTQAARVLSTLDRIHQLRERFNNHFKEKELRNRAIWALDRILRDIDADPTEQEIAQVKAELDALELWLDTTKTEASYWADLLPSIQGLLSEVRVDKIPSGGQNESRELMEKLKQQLTSESSPDRSTIIATEKNYQRLRILWDHRKDAEIFEQLVKLQNDSIEECFRIVDDADWNRLGKLKSESKLKLSGPSPDSLNPIEAYMPVKFQLETGEDPNILNTYLLKKKLTYKWKFEIYARRFSFANNLTYNLTREGELEVISEEPQVMQYSPISGQILLKELSIQYEAASMPIVLKKQEEKNQEPAGLCSVPIGKSKDFRIWRIAEKADFIALFISVVAGVASGLLLYMQNPVFGSLKDYLQLFMWGAGIDQSKNFIQALGSWGSTKT